MTIKDALSDFMVSNHGNILIYNEISLQLELGVYFRKIMPEYNVRFERNIEFYDKDLNKKEFTKREIDLVLFKGDDEAKAVEKYAVELKFPRKGQHPEQMFSFLKDVKFMEEVKYKLGFNATFCLTLVDDPNFYDAEGRGTNGIYKFFRVNDQVSVLNAKETIIKPTGKHDDSITLDSEHSFKWCSLNDDCNWTDLPVNLYRYYLMEI